MEICGQGFCRYHSWAMNDLLRSGHRGKTEKLGFDASGWHFLVGVIVLTASVSSEQESISFGAIVFAYSATFLSLFYLFL